MTEAVKFTPVSTEYKGANYDIPLPVFSVILACEGQDYFLHLYLDTGSNGTMLFPYSIRILYPSFLEGCTENALMANLKQFGDFALNRNQRIRLDFDARLSEAYEKPICSGIVGTDILKDYGLLIDYPSFEFYLHGKEEIKLPFTCTYSFENNFLFLYADVLGIKLKLLYDTGMGGPLLLFERGFAKLPGESFKATSREFANGAFGALYYYDSYEQRMPMVFSNDLNFETGFGVQEKHPFTDFMDCDGILGNQLFAGKKIFIDYPNQRFSFAL